MLPPNAGLSLLMPNILTVYGIVIIRHIIKTIVASATVVESQYQGKPLDFNQFIQSNYVVRQTINLSLKMISISKKVI